MGFSLGGGLSGLFGGKKSKYKYGLAPETPQQQFSREELQRLYQGYQQPGLSQFLQPGGEQLMGMLPQMGQLSGYGADLAQGLSQWAPQATSQALPFFGQTAQQYQDLAQGAGAYGGVAPSVLPTAMQRYMSPTQDPMYGSAMNSYMQDVLPQFGSALAQNRGESARFGAIGSSGERERDRITADTFSRAAGQYGSNLALGLSQQAGAQIPSFVQAGLAPYQTQGNMLQGGLQSVQGGLGAVNQATQAGAGAAQAGAQVATAPYASMMQAMSMMPELAYSQYGFQTGLPASLLQALYGMTPGAVKTGESTKSWQLGSKFGGKIAGMFVP